MVEYFSYDQFCVLYTKFLQLDISRDYMLEKSELMRYGESNILTELVVDRVFAVNLATSPHGRMTYDDFFVFVRADIDKNTQGAIHYWFNVLDIDGDGFLSIHDLRPFYVDSLLRVIYWDIEVHRVSMEDIFTQLIDSTFPHHHLRNNNNGTGADSSADG